MYKCFLPSRNVYNCITYTQIGEIQPPLDVLRLFQCL